MKDEAQSNLNREIAKALRDQAPIRKELPDGGRLHIDRSLPFLFVHIESPDRDDMVARAVTQANAAYALGNGSRSFFDVIKLVAEAARKQFGFALILSLEEIERPEGPNDEPTLLPLEIDIRANAGAGRAAQAFEAAIYASKSGFRLAKVQISIDAVRSLSRLDDLTDFNCLAIRFLPVYREPSSESIYPEVRERLIAVLFDAALQACAAMFEPGQITSHRVLGRRAIVEAVTRVDRSLEEVASSFDVLLAVTPINADEAFGRFAANGYKEAPEFIYRPLALQIEDAKQKLHAISFDQMEDPVLYGLYREKQRELDLQLSLIASRERRTFVELGRAIYGAVEPPLLIEAECILQLLSVQNFGQDVEECFPVADASFVDHAARAMVAAYRDIFPGFAPLIEVRDDLPSGLLVSRDRLLIARTTTMDRRRVAPLLAHEIGVHLLTYFNGSAQGLHLFRSGLSGYEGMQEGLAVFAEFLAGGMTVERLRLIAVRVVACDAMLKGATFAEVFQDLQERLGFGSDVAFNTALRVFRGGGFPKDAIYLRGLLELLNHLKKDGALAPFWMGKIAASHFSVMEELASRGLLKTPGVEPLFLGTPEGKARIGMARQGMRPVEMIQSKES